eukprot:3903992-Rhodomonas_salina.1
MMVCTSQGSRPEDRTLSDVGCGSLPHMHIHQCRPPSQGQALALVFQPSASSSQTTRMLHVCESPACGCASCSPVSSALKRADSSPERSAAPSCREGDDERARVVIGVRDRACPARLLLPTAKHAVTSPHCALADPQGHRRQHVSRAAISTLAAANALPTQTRTRTH